jgi:hypothetical protein
VDHVPKGVSSMTVDHVFFFLEAVTLNELLFLDDVNLSNAAD